MSGDENKTKESLEKILNEDRKNREAMLGLARIAIQNNKLKEAEEWLRKAEAAAPQNARETLGAAEWAVINLMRGDVDKARLLLQKTTDLQPNNLQAWTMLAVIQMQQGELDEVEKVTIPKITTIADTPSNYFVQTVKAHYANLQAEKLLATVKDTFNESSPVGKKIRSYQSQAREAFITAAKLRPDLPDIKNRILQLDVVMNDRESAELHARQALRQNRKHPLANYIMGSCRLQEGEYDSAESFLRDSISEQPPNSSSARFGSGLALKARRWWFSTAPDPVRKRWRNVTRLSVPPVKVTARNVPALLPNVPALLPNGANPSPATRSNLTPRKNV